MKATDILVSDFEYKTSFLPKDRKFEGKDALDNKLAAWSKITQRRMIKENLSFQTAFCFS